MPIPSVCVCSSAAGTTATVSSKRRPETMDFQLTREQELLRDTVRSFATDVLKPRAAGFDRSREFPHDNYGRCAAMGLCGMMVPEAYGGPRFGGVSYGIRIRGAP